MEGGLRGSAAKQAAPQLPLSCGLGGKCCHALPVYCNTRWLNNEEPRIPVFMAGSVNQAMLPTPAHHTKRLCCLHTCTLRIMQRSIQTPPLPSGANSSTLKSFQRARLLRAGSVQF